MSNCAVVFDLDGTLIDSLPDLRAALNKMLRAIDRPELSPEVVRKMIGDGTATLVRRALEATGGTNLDVEAAHQRFLHAYQSALANLSRPYPGVEATLKALSDSGSRLGICTNKQQPATLAVLQAFDLAKYFEVIVGGDVVPFRKPDPRHLFAALERLRVEPADAVMVGDGVNDYAVARAAGMAVILMRYGYLRVAPESLSPDAWLDDFAEIPAALEAIQKA